MRMVYYEIRKFFLKTQTFLLLLAGICLNFAYIGYLSWNGDLNNAKLNDYFLTCYDSKEIRNAYRNLHEQLDGQLTQDKVNMILETYEYIQYETQDDKEDFGKFPYTGYVNNEKRLIKKYFFDPMYYMVHYNDYAEHVSAYAEDTCNMYQLFGQWEEANYWRRIHDSFLNRRIDIFCDSAAWQSLIEYQTDDLIIILLMIILILPFYLAETNTGMNDLIQTSYKGKDRLHNVKWYSMLIISAIVVLLFFLSSIVAYRIFFGISQFNFPLYGIYSYRMTLFKGSVFYFLLIKASYSLLAVWNLGMIILICSYTSKSSISGCTKVILIILGESYFSNFMNSVQDNQKWLAMLSPCSLFKIEKLFYEPDRISAGMVKMESWLALLIVQVLLFIVTFVLQMHIGGKRHEI